MCSLGTYGTTSSTFIKLTLNFNLCIFLEIRVFSTKKKRESCPGAIPLKHQKILVTGLDGAVVSYSIVKVNLELAFVSLHPPKPANATGKLKCIQYG